MVPWITRDLLIKLLQNGSVALKVLTVDTFQKTQCSGYCERGVIFSGRFQNGSEIGWNLNC